MHFNLPAVFSLLCVSFLIAGCSETPQATDDAPAPITSSDEYAPPSTDTPARTEFANAFCPIELKAISGEGEVTTWNNQTIGYCCDGCKEKFEALSDDDKKAALAKADEAAKKAKEPSDASDAKTEPAKS